MKTNRILFFKLGAIGDTLMTTPLLRQVKKGLPNSKIDYLIGNHSAPVLEGNKHLNKIITFDEMIFVKRKIFAWLKLIRKIRKEKYDLIFVLDKHWVFNLTALLFGIPKRVGFDRMRKEGIFLTHKVYYGNIRHEIYCYLDLAKAIGLKVDYSNHKMDIVLSKEDKEFAEEFWKKNKWAGKKVIGIAPGGSKNYADDNLLRRIPLEKVISLIKKLISKKDYIILIGGKEDQKGLEEKILKIINSEYLISLLGKTSLKESGTVFKKCNLIICNDAGPMHLAASVNHKIISIFGPTHPLRKAPLWKEAKWVWKAEDIYNQNDETYGTYKKRNYFTNLFEEGILNKL